MSKIFQDTAFGHSLRLITRSKVLAWPEQSDTALAQSYLETSKRPLSDSEEKSNEPGSDDDLKKSGQVTIDWLDNDADNPLDWSSGKKAWVSAQICLLTTSVYVGAAIYTAGITGVQEDFQVSSVAALLGLTLFIIGYGLGPMIWCPIADLPGVGRSPVYIGTLVIFVAFQPCIIYARNFGMLLAFRFLTGFFGSPSLALGGASATDMYRPQKLPYAISFWGASAAFGPVLGPVCAGFAAQRKGWTWTIWELLWLSGFCLVVLILFLPETLEANILHRRAGRLQRIMQDKQTKQANNTSSQLIVKSRPDREAEAIDNKEMGKTILTQIFVLSFFEPIVIVLNLYIALVYALLYLWFESFPLVFMGIYNFSPGLLGISFVGILVGTLIALPCYVLYVRLYVEPLYATPQTQRKLTPELNMIPACVGAFFIPASMLVFAWTSRTSVHWIGPIIGTALFPLGIFPLFMSVIGYLTQAYPKYIASVLAGNDLMRAGFGAGFPLFANAMFNKLGIDWGNTLLALLSALFIPVPFVLLKYGATIRRMSKKAVQDED